MAEYRIKFYDGKLIRFSFKDYADGGKTSNLYLLVITLAHGNRFSTDLIKQENRLQ